MEFPDYYKIVLELTYKKPFIIVLICVGVLCLALLPLYFLGILYNDQPPYLAFVLGVYIVFVRNVIIKVTARKNFNSYQRLQEEITYELTPEKMKVTGESFYSEVDWKATFKILEIKRAFLIYGSSVVANIISKKNMTQDEIISVRMLLGELKEVSNKKLLKS